MAFYHQVQASTFFLKQLIAHKVFVTLLSAVSIYEVCPKSNKTDVIKAVLKSIEIYQSQIPSKQSPSTLKHLCICLFEDSIPLWKAFSGIFLSSVVAAILMESMSEKWVLFRTDLILVKRKSHTGPDQENMGGGGVFQSCNVPFCNKLTNTQGCVIRSIIVMEHPCVGFPKAPSLVMHCLIRCRRMSLRHRSFQIPTPRPNSEPNRL